MKIAVGISGASGAIYGLRLLERLRSLPGVEIHLILSRAGEKTLFLETGRLAAVVVSGMLGKAMLCEAEGGEASSWPLFDAMAPVLPGFRKAPKFVF